jgi:hypothetical protein
MGHHDESYSQPPEEHPDSDVNVPLALVREPEEGCADQSGELPPIVNWELTGGEHDVSFHTRFGYVATKHP